MPCLDKLNTCMSIELNKLLEKSINLEKIDFSSSSKELNEYINKVNSLIEDLSYTHAIELKKTSEEIQILLKKHQSNVLNLSEYLKKIVFSDHAQYIKYNETIWRENFENMLFHENLEWSKLCPPNKTEFSNFSLRVSHFCNWQYPAIIYGSKDYDLITTMSSSDPLYVVEQYNEYITLQKERYHPDFVRKLKFYRFNDINLLPKNDVGLAVVFNEFPFLPWDTIVFILEKLINCLMPGGTLIFNYNNCLTVRGFKEFEARRMVYTTPDMFIKFLCKQHFTIEEHYISDKETFSYLIFKKAGSRELIKRYPSVGFVKQQPTFINQDLHHKNRIELLRKLYNR